MLDFRSAEFAVLAILQQPNRNVRIPEPDARDAWAREMQVKTMAGNYNSLDRHSSESITVLRQSKLTSGGVTRALRLPDKPLDRFL
jgi:hypothetical protein